MQQQTATADVLKIISRSTFDLHAVLNTLARSAVQLCEANIATIWRPCESVYRLAAVHETTLEHREYLEGLSTQPGRGSCVGRTLLEGRIVHIHDTYADPEYSLELSKLRGFRTQLGVPLMREGVPIGVIVLIRTTVRPFTDKQIKLATAFADQAVIAIENVRLFDEVQARTDDLAESLEQQTATSEVLKVISSSPGELQPVFQSLLENATRICGAKFGALWLREGELFRAVAVHGAPQAYRELLFREPIRPGPDTGLGQLLQTKQFVQIEDITRGKAYRDRDPLRVATVELAGGRTLAEVPLLKDGELIGSINIYKQEVRPFTDKQIELLQNFAAQAVIAVENTRLLNELRRIYLQQQTATCGRIQGDQSSSTFDLQPVFQATLVESAAAALRGRHHRPV